MSQSPFAPIARAVGQLSDRTFLGVLWRSVAWAALCLVGIHLCAIWLVHHVLALHGIAAWAADVLGAAGVSLLSLWLFIPVATAIGTLYIERIARAVEQRFYPRLSPARGASIADQTWDGVAVALRVLSFNTLALVLALALPGAGVILGWMITAYAIGRGLFVAVAMRRMSRADAEQVYGCYRGTVLTQGAVLALAAYFPILNLLLPLLGTAAMVHVLDHAMGTMSLRFPDSVRAAP